MTVGMLTLHLHLPGCGSLKEKRRRLKPLLVRLHREFNISVAEIDYLDSWQDALIACALVGNDHRYAQRTLSQVVRWVETHWPDISLISEQLELI